MRRLLLVSALCALLGAFPASAPAITAGQPDGNGHPYVAYLDNGVFACSGTLISPTVLITAAHCFSDSTSAFGKNSVTGASLVRATFDPNLINTPRAQRVWWFASYYFDPQFTLGGCGSPAGLRPDGGRRRDLHRAGLRRAAEAGGNEQLRADSRQRDAGQVRSPAGSGPGRHAADGNRRRPRRLRRPELRQRWRPL